MKKIQIFLLLTISLFVVGCKTVSEAPSVKTMSQVETRQLQTRTYSGVDMLTGLKSVVSALQDEGYLIESTNDKLGIITAQSEVKTELKGARQYAEDWTYNGTYETVQRIIVSATVSEFGKDLKVRVNMVRKAFNQNGGVIWSVPIQEAKHYQAIFTKVDKSLFLAKQNL